MSPLLAPNDAERQTPRRALTNLQRAPSPPASRSPGADGRAPRVPQPRARRQSPNTLPRIEPEQLFALSRDALVVVDAATRRIRAWNPHAEALFGFPATSAVDRSIDLIMPPDVARLHHERLAHFARTGDPTILHCRSDVVSEFVGQDNRPRSVTVAADELHSDSQTGLHLVLFTIRSAVSAETSAELNAVAAPASPAESPTHQAGDTGQDPPDSTAVTLRQQVHRAQRTAAHLTRALGAQRLAPARIACLSRIMELRVSEISRCLAAREDLRALSDEPAPASGERINLVPLFASLVAEFRAATGTLRGATNAGNAFPVNLAMPQGFTIQADPERVAYVMRFLLADARRRNPRGCWIDVDLRRPLGGLAHIGVRDYGRALTEREAARLPNRPTTDDDWLLLQGIVMRMGGTLACDLPAEGGVRIGIDLPVNGIRRPRDAR